MRKFFTTLALVVVLGGVYYQYEDAIRAQVEPVVYQILFRLRIISVPCEEPVHYTLGTFDTKFGISKNYFLETLTEAEGIWEGPYGKELFMYQSPEADGGSDILHINLVYDYRQDATNTLKGLGIIVENTRASYDKLRSQLDEMKIRFDKTNRDFTLKVEDFNKIQKIYEDKVRYWNAQGGAPKGEYEKLQAEKNALDKSVSKLQSMQKEVNKLADEINALVVVLNRLASTLNISVEKYNTVGASRGESFEEGVYYDDGIRRKIDIYEFSSRDKLLRVLAHELGHALELEHVEDPKAIMYKLNQGDSKKLSLTDIEALEERCGAR